MFNKKVFALLAVTAVIAAPITIYVKIVFSEVGLMELYPDVPQRIIIIAHRRMIRDILTRRIDLGWIENDDQLGEYFMSNYVNPLLGL